MSQRVNRKMLQICDRGMSAGSEHNDITKCYTITFYIVMFIISIGFLCSRLNRQFYWIHTQGTVIDIQKHTTNSRGGKQTEYLPVISYQPLDEEEESYTFVSNYWSRTNDTYNNMKYPIDGTTNNIPIVYNPNNYHEGEIVDVNTKGIIFGSSILIILCFINFLLYYIIYKQAIREIQFEERYYPTGYEIHDQDDQGNDQGNDQNTPTITITNGENNNNTNIIYTTNQRNNGNSGGLMV